MMRSPLEPECSLSADEAQDSGRVLVGSQPSQVQASIASPVRREGNAIRAGLRVNHAAPDDGDHHDDMDRHVSLSEFHQSVRACDM